MSQPDAIQSLANRRDFILIQLDLLARASPAHRPRNIVQSLSALRHRLDAVEHQLAQLTAAHEDEHEGSLLS